MIPQSPDDQPLIQVPAQAPVVAPPPVPQAQQQPAAPAPAWQGGMDSRIELQRHPLRGVTAHETTPPATWTPSLLQALQRPRARTDVQPEDVMDLVRRTWAPLDQLVARTKLDLADLHPYRCKAAWRIVRGRLIEDGLLAATDPLHTLEPRQIASCLPPPAPADLTGYDPLADSALEAFLNRASHIALTRYLDHGTANDPSIGQYQLHGLLNPFFARAGWPTLFELFITETAMTTELVREMSNVGAMQLRSYLASEGMLGLEAEQMVAYVIAQAQSAYMLEEDEMQALFLAQLDDIARRARDDYSLNTELNARKTAAVVAGLGRNKVDLGLGDIVAAMQRSVDIDSPNQTLLPNKDDDPLLLEGDR